MQLNLPGVCVNGTLYGYPLFDASKVMFQNLAFPNEKSEGIA